MSRRVLSFSALLIFFLLVGCATDVTHSKTLSSKSINIFGTVEQICAGCDIFDLVGGGSLEWDVVTVRVKSPEALAGTEISVEILLDGDGIVQREKLYPLSASIEFVATNASFNARKVMLHTSDIRAAH